MGDDMEQHSGFAPPKASLDAAEDARMQKLLGELADIPGPLASIAERQSSVGSIQPLGSIAETYPSTGELQGESRSTVEPHLDDILGDITSMSTNIRGQPAPPGGGAEEFDARELLAEAPLPHMVPEAPGG